MGLFDKLEANNLEDAYVNIAVEEARLSEKLTTNADST